jgi:hypothetical protein
VRRAVALAVVLLLAACRHDPPAAGKEQPDAGPSPSASAAGHDGDSVLKPGGAGVLDDGREPRSVLSFAFVRGRREGRVLEMNSHLELAGKTRVDEHLELRFAVAYPAVDRVELTLRRAATTARDIPSLDSTLGARIVQNLGKNGAVDPPGFIFPDGANGTAAQYVKGAVTEAAGAFLPQLPPTPIGVDARWRWSADAPTFRLDARHDPQLVLVRTTEIHEARRLERGRPIQIDEEQSTRIETTLDGIARHIDGQLVTGKGAGTKRTTQLKFDVIDPP